jgi:hypothetical protein
LSPSISAAVSSTLFCADCSISLYSAFFASAASLIVASGAWGTFCGSEGFVLLDDDDALKCKIY